MANDGLSSARPERFSGSAQVVWDGTKWIAAAASYPGVSGEGDSPQAAATAANTAYDDLIAALEDDGRSEADWLLAQTRIEG